LALRGGDLRATIQTSDPDVARQLEGRLGELRQALTERGFAGAKVGVQVAHAGEAGVARPGRQEDAREREGGRPGDHAREERAGRDGGRGHGRPSGRQEEER
jgi:hypothetical protein